MADPDDPDDPDTSVLDLFTEPVDYYPPSPKPTTQTHTLSSGTVLTLRLVGHNPLWGHHLWQAGRIVSCYLESHPLLIANKTVLELGAGAGLPSLVCASLGARTVVVTDYPDPPLIENLSINIDTYVSSRPTKEIAVEKQLVAEGYCWGAEPSSLLRYTPEGFDVLILADLLFNHSEHRKLLATLKLTLKRSSGSRALVFFSPYRPWLYEKDMAFFDLAREAGMKVEKVLEEKVEKIMFAEDRGDEELRRTVFGWVVRWGDQIGSVEG